MKYAWRNEWVFIVDSAIGREIVAALQSSAGVGGSSIDRVCDRYFDSHHLDTLLGPKRARKHQFRLRRRSDLQQPVFERKTFKGRRVRLKQAKASGSAGQPGWFASSQTTTCTETLCSRYLRQTFSLDGQQSCAVTLDEAVRFSFPLFGDSPSTPATGESAASSLTDYQLGSSILKFKLDGPLNWLCKRLIYDFQLSPEKTSIYREGVVAAASSTELLGANVQWQRALAEAGVGNA